MNADPLKPRWQPPPLRPVPAAWRDPILAAARAAADEASTSLACGRDAAQASEASRLAGISHRGIPAPPASVGSWLRAWLWPHPVAWGSLAVTWALIAVLNSAADGPLLAVVRLPAASTAAWAGQAAVFEDWTENGPAAPPVLPASRLPMVPVPSGSTSVRSYENQMA